MTKHYEIKGNRGVEYVPCSDVPGIMDRVAKGLYADDMPPAPCPPELRKHVKSVAIYAIRIVDR